MNPSDSPNLLSLELAEQRCLGNVCEASGIFLHELGNSLNVMLFELALLERQAPEALRSSLAGLREVGRRIAQQMQEMRRYEDGQRSALYPVDLNAVIREAVAQGLTEPQPELTLTADLPPVQGTVGDVQRLLRMLTAVVLQMPEMKFPVGLQTRRLPGHAQLWLVWNGPNNAELPTPPPENEGHLTWDICQRLLRRLRGRLRLEPLPSGGGALIVDLLLV